MVKNFNNFIQSFASLDGKKLSFKGLEDYIETVEAFANRIVALRDRVGNNKQGRDLFEQLGFAGQGINYFLTSIQNADPAKFGQALDAIVDKMEQSSQALQSEQKVIYQTTGTIKKAFEEDLPKATNFTDSIDGIKNAINNLNTAFTGAKFNEQTGVMYDNVS